MSTTKKEVGAKATGSDTPVKTGQPWQQQLKIEMAIDNKSPRTTGRVKKSKERLGKTVQPIKPSQEEFGILNRKMSELTSYTFDRYIKYPKSTKQGNGLANYISALTNDCLSGVVTLTSYNPKTDKENVCRGISVKLKTLETLVENSYDKHYIHKNNLDAWLRKLSELDNTVIGLAMFYQKLETKKSKDGDGETA